MRNLDSAATAFLEGNVLSNPANVSPTKIETHYRVQLDTRRYRKIIAKMSKDFFSLTGHVNNGPLKAAIDNYNRGWREAGNTGTPPFSLGNFPDADQSGFEDFVIDRTVRIFDFDIYGNIINSPPSVGGEYSDATDRDVTHLLVSDIKATFPNERVNPDVRNTRLAFMSASLRQAQTAQDVTNLLFTINSSALP